MLNAKGKIVIDRKSLIRILVMLAGAAAAFVALFAFQLGLDNNPQMGRGRLVVLAGGSALIVFGASYWFFPWMVRIPALAGLSRWFEVEDDEPRSVPSGAGTDLLLILLAVFAFFYYGWVIGAGRFLDLPSGKDYYGLLSEAFLKGQVSLLVEPSAELLALENPYDLDQRRDLDFLWDITLYKGKYYLYWGPAPAVLGALYSLLTSRPVTDAGLVLTLVAGAAFFSLLLLRRLDRIQSLPRWLFWGGALIFVFNIPLIWMLTRPKYYEVATAGGLCFIMAGLYFSSAALSPVPTRNKFLTLASLSFGLAAASRMSLIPGILFIVAMLGIKILLDNREKKRWLAGLSALALPLAVVGGLLAWYNYVRFGSIFEFGFSYTLTGPTVSPLARDVFAPVYIPPNLYTYFLRPPSVGAEFPFVRLEWIREEMWPSFVSLPDGYYYTDPTAGILLIIPVVGLALLAAGRLLWRWINGDYSPSWEFKPAGLFLFILFGYGFIQTIVLSVFIASNVRYLLDISQALAFLALLFYSVHLSGFAVNRVQRNLAAAAWIIAALAAVVMGLLIGITGDKNLFLNQNPELYYKLMDWFSF